MSKVITYEFGPSFSDVVLAELDTRFSRASVKISPTENALSMGSVLMKKADGSYTPLTETAASGEGETATPAKLDGTACAVLISALPASEAARTGIVLRGYAIVNSAALVFDSSVNKKEEALADLAKAGFILENIKEVENGIA